MLIGCGCHCGIEYGSSSSIGSSWSEIGSSDVSESDIDTTPVTGCLPCVVVPVRWQVILTGWSGNATYGTKYNACCASYNGTYILDKRADNRLLYGCGAIVGPGAPVCGVWESAARLLHYNFPSATVPCTDIPLHPRIVLSILKNPGATPKLIVSVLFGGVIQFGGTGPNAFFCFEKALTSAAMCMFPGQPTFYRQSLSGNIPCNFRTGQVTIGPA